MIGASLSWINRTRSALALAIRNGGGENETVIPRNAKLADVEQSLRHLRSLGFKDVQLSRLFNHKGNSSGLAQHVKVRVANLR